MSRKAIVFFTILLFLFPIIADAQGTSFSNAHRITSGLSWVYITSSQRYHYYIYRVDAYNVSICAAPRHESLDVNIRIYYTNLSLYGSSLLGPGATDCVRIVNQQTRDFYIEVSLDQYSPMQYGYYDLVIAIHQRDPPSTQTPTQQQQTQQVSVAGCNCQTACRDCGITGSNWWEQIQSAFNPSRWGACICCHLACPIAEFFNNVRQMFAGIVNSITGFFTGIADSIVGFFTSIRDFFQRIIDSVVGFFTGIRDFIIGIFNSVAGFFTGIAQGIMNFFGAMGSFLASMPAAIINFFNSFVSTISSALGGAGSALGGAGGWLGRNWPYVIGLVMIGLGFIFGAWLSILGFIVIVGYMLTVGDIDWRMIILAVGAAIVVFALKD